MSSFTDPLVVSPNDDASSWTVMQPFRYWIEALHKGYVITIPVGTQTDFASIPRLFWNILPPTGRYGKAAVVHDYLYRNGGLVNVAESGLFWKQFSRAECDQIFLDAMECLGVGWFTRHAMYRAVRMFGMWAFKKSPVVGVT